MNFKKNFTIIQICNNSIRSPIDKKQNIQYTTHNKFPIIYKKIK